MPSLCPRAVPLVLAERECLPFPNLQVLSARQTR
jgi:hypothetical protein